ncbi:MAG: hypothetical protein NVSMB15_15000 [Steroidobacteraceae bacterium]
MPHCKPPDRDQGQLLREEDATLLGEAHRGRVDLVQNAAEILELEDTAAAMQADEF